MASNSAIHFFPRRLSRMLLLSIEEIVGHSGLNAVVNRAGISHLINREAPNDLAEKISFDEVSKLLESIEHLYGSIGGRGLVLRSGRVFFQMALREFADELELKDANFRLLPLDKKIIMGLEIWTKLFDEPSNLMMKVEEHLEKLLWIMDPCPFCWNRTDGNQICYLPVGMLQEALYWISGGKFYNIEEIECAAKGDASCKIEISKTPLE